MERRFSYTSADIFPIKIFYDEKLLRGLRNGRILPRHVSLNPTNRCNKNCQYCSYSARDRTVEMSMADIRSTMFTFEQLGTRAVTITGGGEPLMHDNISEIISFLYDDLLMSVGFTTNGWFLFRIKEVLGKLAWLRVSVDSFEDPLDVLSIVREYIPYAPKLNWSISFVVTKHLNYQYLFNAIMFAEDHPEISHVRIVSDLLDLENLPDMSVIKKAVPESEKVIWQDRHAYERGMNPCLISLLKPNISADGFIYPCCGTQYATEIPQRDFAKGFEMGKLIDSEDIWKEQKAFNGSVCSRCYYWRYNQTLSALMQKVDHVEFV